jgi:D-3-phosphoglycerate dehydrogenase
VDVTVFVALADVIDNLDARAALERNFSTIVVATARERAVAELTALGDTVDAAIVGVREQIDTGVLTALPRLRVVGSVGAGTDHLNLAALADRGVQVITTPGINAVSVAEHEMMTLALAKRALPAHVAVLLRAIGTDVVVWTRHPDRHPDLPTAGLDEIFSGCGIVSVHLPLTPQTRGLVNARLLRLLPPGALLVNVARKEIVDPDGLREVVSERSDLWFAVDDFGLATDGTVAVVGDHGLCSPHVAGVTVEALAAMQNVVIRGVVQAVSGPC